METKRPSPERFAAAIADRLNRIVPEGIVVRADGGYVVVSAGTSWSASDMAYEIQEDEEDGIEWPLVRRMDHAAGSIIDGVQDFVMEVLTEQWPLTADNRLAMANSRVDGEQVVIWFGGEDAPVLVLAPLCVADALE